MIKPRIILERRPPAGWRRLPGRPRFVGEKHVSVWRKLRLMVISALDEMTVADHPSGVGLTWHVSVSNIDGAPVTDSELATVRRAFGMSDAEEDNHEPGRARHLFLIVDEQYRRECECKVDEQTFVEPSGHRWQSPPEDAEHRRRLMEGLKNIDIDKVEADPHLFCSHGPGDPCHLNGRTPR